MSDRKLSHPVANRTVTHGSARGKTKIPRQNVKRRRRRLRLRQLLAAVVLGGGLAYLQLRPWVKKPEAVLVLGGEPRREQFAASFAQRHPGLPIWVSGGSNPEYAEWVFHEAGVSDQLVHLDYEAVDTLTNFTTLVDKLQARGIDSLYLITSDYHMRRAQWIGHVVLGSRGIQFQTVEIPTGKSPEPIEKALFDGLRAVWWLATGQTVTGLKPDLHGRTADP